MKTRVLLTLLLVLGLTAFAFGQKSKEASPKRESRRDQLEGLVYETEEWSEPKDGWVQDKSLDNKWCLWTKEEDVWKKRSGGQSLKTPAVRKDRQSPEEGAPPLHTKITGIPKGFYRVYTNATNRLLAFSFDGKNWAPSKLNGEEFLGFFDIQDGIFEVWVDDRYVNLQNIGSAYYDYIRFVESEPPTLSDVKAFTLPNGDTQISWISSSPLAPAIVRPAKNSPDFNAVTEEFDGLRNHLVVLSGLKKGQKYTAEVFSELSRRGNGMTKSITFIAGDRPVASSTKKAKIRLTVSEPADHARKDWPVTSGVPFAKGALADITDVRLVNESGKPVPAQFDVTSRWPDGSVKWLLVDFVTDTNKEKPVLFYLETKKGINPDAKKVDDNAIDLKEIGKFLSSRITLADGQILTSKAEPFTWETQGKLRNSAVSQGDYLASDGTPKFRWRCNITKFRSSMTRVQWWIGNNQVQDDHTLLHSASVDFKRDQAVGQTAGGLLTDGSKAARELVVVQDLEKHATINRDGKVAEMKRFDGYVRTGDSVNWCRDFWQTWPKGLTCNSEKIQYYLLPELPTKNYPPENWTSLDETFQHFYWYKDGAWQFKRGMEICGEYWFMPIATDRKVNDSEMCDHFAHPLFAVADPVYYCSTGTFPPVNPRRKGVFDTYEKAFDTSFKNLEEGRVKRGDYGWMNFGDWFGERNWNWGNNEYDLSYVCSMQFIRTGNLDFLNRGIEMARHYTTVDFNAWPWRPRTRELEYAHSTGHVGGFVKKDDSRLATLKRFVANLVGSADGSGGHSFQPGSFFIGCLTGDQRIFQVAEEVCTNQARYYTPAFNFSIERSAGWALTNATNAYLFTGNPYYLNAAKLYYEVIKTKQNMENGCFELPQDQSECDCPDKKEHRGGKAFAVGVLMHSLARYYEVSGNPDVKQTIIRCADWLIDTSWNEARKGFRYKTGCPKYANSGWYSVIVAEGIAYAGELSGDSRYIEFVARTLGPELSRANGTGPASGKDFTQRHRQLPHVLYWLEQHGYKNLDSK